MTARDRIVIMVVLALGAVVAGWFLVVSPKRSQASSLSTQVTSEQSQLTAAQGQVAAGMSAQKAFAGQYAQLAKLGEAVPPDDDIPSLIYQVQSAAQATHVSFRGLQLSGGGSSSSTPELQLELERQLVDDPGRAASPRSERRRGRPPDRAVHGHAQRQLLQPVELLQPARELRDQRDNGTLTIRGRLMTINAINLVPGPNGFPQITATVSATTYIVPPTEGPFGGATPAGPAPTTQAQTSTSGSSSSTPRPPRPSPRCCDERPPQHAQGTGRAQALADRAGADHRPGGGAGAADQEGADRHRHPAHRSAALLLGDHAARDLGADHAGQLEAHRQGPQPVHPAAGRHDGYDRHRGGAAHDRPTAPTDHEHGHGTGARAPAAAAARAGRAARRVDAGRPADLDDPDARPRPRLRPHPRRPG